MSCCSASSSSSSSSASAPLAVAASASGGCPSAQRQPSQSERLNLTLTDNGHRRELNGGEACGRDVVSFCCFGDTFPSLSAIIVEYYWTGHPTSLHLLSHGIIGATQIDAALWESAVTWVASDAGRSTNYRLLSHYRLSYTPNAQLERKQVNVMPIPYLAAWERVLKCIPPAIVENAQKEYCSGTRLRYSWLAPVYGADGKFDSMMGCDWRYPRTVVMTITDLSGTSTRSTAIKVPESSFLSEKPARVTRVLNWRVKGELVFTILEQLKKPYQDNPDVCDHGVLKVWAGCKPKPKWYSDTYSSRKTLFRTAFNRRDSVPKNWAVITNDFIIDPPLPLDRRDLAVYRYWFCHQEETLKFSPVSLDLLPSQSLAHSTWARSRSRRALWSRAYICGSTLYTFTSEEQVEGSGYRVMKSWDVSIQSHEQGKFGEPLGIHLIYCDEKLPQPVPVCELDGGRMIFHIHKPSSETRRNLFVFGPHRAATKADPPASAGRPEAAAAAAAISDDPTRETPEDEENPMEKKRRVA